jgi:hypothetical protein
MCQGFFDYTCIQYNATVNHCPYFNLYLTFTIITFCLLLVIGAYLWIRYRNTPDCRARQSGYEVFRE